MAIVALYALAEIAAGIGLAWLGDHGRVDLLPFVAVRPWALLLCAVLIGRGGFGRSAAILAVGVILASLGQAAGIAALKGPAGEAWRALPAGLIVAAIAAAIVAGARWAGGRGWPALAIAIGAGLLVLPGVPSAIERVAIGPASPPPRPDRPPVALWSGLPLLWDEAGVGATLARTPGTEPAAIAGLRRQTRLLPVAGPAAAPADAVMLVIQPHAAPADLVALDAHVSAGGRALILIDPDLRWPTAFPPGDPRRPPGTDPLAPLLAHWRLRLAEDGGDPLRFRQVRIAGETYRIRAGAPGRWTGPTPDCAVLADGLIADCRIGRGRAVLLADADLLADPLWTGQGARGAERHGRIADNGPAMIALVDALAGKAPDADDVVRWIDSP